MLDEIRKELSFNELLYKHKMSYYERRLTMDESIHTFLLFIV
jgi:hypothetical protein